MSSFLAVCVQRQLIHAQSGALCVGPTRDLAPGPRCRAKGPPLPQAVARPHPGYAALPVEESREIDLTARKTFGCGCAVFSEGTVIAPGTRP